MVGWLADVKQSGITEILVETRNAVWTRVWQFLQVPHANSVVSDNTFILSIWSAASIAAARWALTISSERTVQASAERTKRNRQHNKAHVHYCNYVMIQRLMLNETFSLS